MASSTRDSSGSEAADPLHLRVLSLNCWGLPVFSKDLEARMRAIGRVIKWAGYDIVGLQEIYREEDRQRVLQEAAPAGLVHSQYFRSGIFGSGLFLLSRFPIMEAGFARFRLNGRPNDLIRSDYYAGKGVGRVQVYTPAGPIDVYNTHLIAPYMEIGDDVFYTHRIAQTWDLSRFINALSGGTPLIVTCDINSPPERLTYRALQNLTGLTDTFRVVNPNDPGITVTTEIPYLRVHEPECMDYVFCRDGENRHWKVVASEITMKHVAPEFQNEILAYSDHYGVSTTLQLGAPASGQAPELPVTSILTEVKPALQEGLNKAQAAQSRTWKQTGISAALALLLLATQVRPPISRRMFLRVLSAMVAASFLLVSGVNLSQVIQLEREVRTFRMILEELEQVAREHHPLHRR